MFRVDGYPTHVIEGFKLRPGKALPFGATIVAGGVNFSVFSRFATACDLALFRRHEAEPFAVLPFPESFRIGNVFAMVVFGLNFEDIEYGYRMDGPFDPASGQRFEPTRILLDPYARAISGRNIWGETPDWDRPVQFRGGIVPDDFDWQDDKPLEIPFGDLVIYEAHVRGLTRHCSSGVRYPGTYAGLREKIPYLKDLGVNCLELMPIHEFDEFENSRRHPETGETLLNYWGYGTIGFFAPKAGYAATGRLGMQADEFKAMVADLHRNGIEVMLDIVFNHTGEGNEHGPMISFRGIDNKTYYMLTPGGHYWNFSGCGNTLNCNNPVVRGMILDCLRTWASEYHIDGFRFDLASILGRDQNGAPMASPPLLETLAFDPILGKCKLIAEAWDAGGLYQVGSFPSWGRWAEWNGRYRDDLRDFLRGEGGRAECVAQRLAGSPDLYRWQRDTHASVNFITCHDGFTLHDLVSYNGKHNEANGEYNADGANDNRSWNCGPEGETDDDAVLALRGRQMRNAFALLLLSQGVPMLLAGDEFAQTQGGNNNSYCHDNARSWLDWSRLETYRGLHRFVRLMIALRRDHPVLRAPRFLDTVTSPGATAAGALSWHGVQAWRPDFSSSSRTLAFVLCGKAADGSGPDYVYVGANMHWEAHTFELPIFPGVSWRIAVNTGMPAPEDAWPAGKEPEPADPCAVLIGPRSVVVLLG